MRGDPTYFTRADEVERAWELMDPIEERWGYGCPTFASYPARGARMEAGRAGGHPWARVGAAGMAALTVLDGTVAILLKTSTTKPAPDPRL